MATAAVHVFSKMAIFDCSQNHTNHTGAGALEAGDLPPLPDDDDFGASDSGHEEDDAGKDRGGFNPNINFLVSHFYPKKQIKSFSKGKGCIFEPKDAAKSPFIYKDVKTGKQFLVDPEERKELCLPGKDDPKGNGCDDWVVVNKEGAFFLKSDKNKGIKDREVAVVMQGRKAKVITDESRLEHINTRMSGTGGGGNGKPAEKGDGHVPAESEEERRERILKRAQEMAKKKKEEEAQKALDSQRKQQQEDDEKRKKEEEGKRKAEEEENRKKAEEETRKAEEEEKRKKAEEEEVEAAALAEQLLKDEDKKGKTEKSEVPSTAGPSSPLRPRARQNPIDKETEPEMDSDSDEKDKKKQDLS